MRYFEGGLNHLSFDAPHNDSALKVWECEACVGYARQILAIRQAEGLDAAQRAHTDMRIASIENEFGGDA